MKGEVINKYKILRSHIVNAREHSADLGIYGEANIKTYLKIWDEQ
jgi:hypothetical protein